MSFELGWATLLALGIGAVSLVRRRMRSPAGPAGPAGPAAPAGLASPGTCVVAIVGALLFVGGVFMTTAASGFVYRLFPLLVFVQFPWRFLALAALGGALLGGLSVGVMTDRAPPRIGIPVALGAAALAVILALPILGPKTNIVLPAWSVDPAEMWKRNDTTTKGEYLPLQVVEARRPRGFTEGLYDLEGEALLTGVSRRAGRWSFRAESTEPVTVTLRDVAYPGWAATANGSPVPLGHRKRSGNLTLTLPAGTHDVEVTLEPTRRRRAARGISLVAALALLGFGGFLLVQGRPRPA